MSVSAALLLTVSLALQPDANLRLYNPHDEAVDAAVTCAGTVRTLRVHGHDVADAGRCAEPALEAPLPLLALETLQEDGVETQRGLGTDSGCETFAVEAPLFACAGATATVVVPGQPGATYAWSVDGATIVSGHGTNQLVLTIGEGPAARVSATVTGACTSTSEAVIAVRKPLAVEKLDVPATASASGPVTVKWSYAAGLAPASQLLTGDAFEAPVTLAADARSYTWTPSAAGVRNVELQASYAPSIVTKPVGRRRATAKTRASATACPSARASAQIDFRGCGTRTITVNAPDSVEAGETFIATVALRGGESAKWTVTQGSIVSGANSDTVTVKAAETGDISLKLSVTSAPDCVTSVFTRIAIGPRAVCSTAAPAASLSVEKQSCNGATVKATFQGTPPFSGMWTDGTTFQTSSATLTHDFTTPGTYSLRNFRDGLCAGSVTAPVRVAVFPPTVSLASNGSCPGSKVTATFTGTPPFEGRWTDGKWFTTNEMSLERTVDGSVAIDAFHDAACPTVRRESNLITIAPRPTAWLLEHDYCTTSNTTYLPVRIQDGTPPFAVHWSDGVVSTESLGVPGTIYRIATPKGFEQTVSIVRVTTAGCDAAIIGSPSAVISYHPTPAIDRAKSDLVGCTGKPQKIVLTPDALHPDVQLHWTVEEGTILSGQGTREMTFVQYQGTGGHVKVSSSYPGGSCGLWSSTETYLQSPGRIIEFSVDRAVIKPGESVKVTVKIDDQIDNYGVQVYPAARANTFPLTKGVCTDIYGRNCTYTWTDTLGAGKVGMVLTAGNRCMDPVEAQVTFEIKP
jgi:hypothetical protein